MLQEDPYSINTHMLICKYAGQSNRYEQTDELAYLYSFCHQEIGLIFFWEANTW